ncbi:hypothetical protein D1AOALGA4SA_9810 [Olavius algarvensis Delta 1 endosymbiont]|nr:hypothetical protein D1AOALGA4SA_9810 [Olavius algarvensis Delta 1 endosymbiont]
MKLQMFKNEPGTAEYRISNVEGWNRFPRRRRCNLCEPEASLSLFIK